MDENSAEYDNKGDNSSFEFPKQVLDSISECSPEGFLLFVINERGQIEMFTRPSRDVVESGLRSKALKILNGLCAIEEDDITSQIFRAQSREDPNSPDQDGE